MLWISTRLDNSTRYQYNHKAYTISTRIMYDDYELDYTYSNEFYAQDLDEIYEYHIHNTSYTIQDTYEIDDEYARDSHDYDALAYRHYA